MININIKAKYVRTTVYLMLFGGLLTTLSLTVFHTMQDDAFLIDLVMPPVISIFLLMCLVYLYKRPENIESVIRITILAGGILICIPAWYFTILATGSQGIILMEVMPPVTSILLPITICMVIFLQPRIAIILVLATWAAFSMPIVGYLVNYPEELMSPRGIEILVTLGPTMFFVMALMLVGQGLKQEVSQLHVERSDLKTLSEQDSLTGLYNRRAGDALLNDNVELSDSQFAVIMFDLDHFKKINDTHGHDVGDAILREVVRRCKMRIRSHDLFVRWGGEEFLIFVLDADIKETALLAEQLRIIISAEPMEPGLIATASFGVSNYNKMDTPESLLKRADEALYEAKAAGRNRVVIRE